MKLYITNRKAVTRSDKKTQDTDPVKQKLKELGVGDELAEEVSAQHVHQVRSFEHAMSIARALNFDMNKGMINFGKLVKRAVQVHGKNGHIFTRMQWVSPHDASTGHGVRHIRNTPDMNQAMSHGIASHPHYIDALKEQGFDSPLDFLQNGGEMHLPETERSSKKAKELGIENHIPHKGDTPSKEEKQPKSKIDHVVAEKQTHPVTKQEQTQEKHDLEPAHKGLEHRYEIHPDLHELAGHIDSFEFNDEEHGTLHHKFKALHSIIDSHWDDVRHVLKNSINEDTESSSLTKKAQHNILRTIGSDKIELSKVASHPQLAHRVVNKLLGEKRAHELRSILSPSNLTINMMGDSLPSVLRNGYTCSTTDSYAEGHLSSEGLKKYEELKGSKPHTEDFISELRSLGDQEGGDRGTWRGLHTRMEAEYEKIGLDWDDSRPTYIAYNPAAKSEGGAPSFGFGVVSVNSSILRNSTLASGDTFGDEVAPIPRIHDMSHLANTYILKKAQHDWGGSQGDIFERTHNPYDDDEDYSEPEWLSRDAEQDVCLEIQYHKPHVEPSLLTKFTDRGY